MSRTIRADRMIPFFKQPGCLIGLIVCSMFLAVFAPAVLAQGSGDMPVVLHSEGLYPPLARTAQVQGPVSVEVTIAPDGSVRAARALDGHALLVWAAAESARQWLFVPAKDERTMVLLFQYEGTKSILDESRQEVTFEPPATLHIVNLESMIERIDRIERVDGQIPERRCKVHNEIMLVDVFRISQGCLGGYSDRTRREWRELARARAYWLACDTLFPEANEWKSGGEGFRDKEHMSIKEIYYCPQCREARKEWFLQHPKIKDKY